LLYKGLARVEVLEQGLGLLAPKDSTVLHASAADTLDSREVAVVIFEALQDEIDCVKPHAYRRVDFALCRILEDTLLDAIFVLEFIVEGDFGLVMELECRVNYDT